MRHHLLTATLAAGLLLAGCTTATPEATVTEPTNADAERRPVVPLLRGTVMDAGDLEIRTVLSGGGVVDLIVLRGPDSEDVTLDVGESVEVFGHTLELLSADSEEALLAVTAPDGTQLGL